MRRSAGSVLHCGMVCCSGDADRTDCARLREYQTDLQSGRERSAIEPFWNTQVCATNVWAGRFLKFTYPPQASVDISKDRPDNSRQIAID